MTNISSILLTFSFRCWFHFLTSFFCLNHLCGHWLILKVLFWILWHFNHFSTFRLLLRNYGLLTELCCLIFFMFLIFLSCIYTCPDGYFLHFFYLWDLMNSLLFRAQSLVPLREDKTNIHDRNNAIMIGAECQLKARLVKILLSASEVHSY
jgi:hypothetical protein